MKGAGHIILMGTEKCVQNFGQKNLYGRETSKFPVIWYPSIQNSYELVKISKKIYHFTKLLEKQSYDVHMFTWQYNQSNV
jgi:hypothetical protein